MHLNVDMLTLYIPGSPVVHRRHHYQGEFSPNTYPMFPFAVPAGAVFAYSSECSINGTVMFTHNQARLDGGEEGRPSCTG